MSSLWGLSPRGGEGAPGGGRESGVWEAGVAAASGKELPMFFMDK